MKSTFLAMVAFFALALSAAAQQALSGRVVDPSGALVRNAVVTVRAGAEPRSPVAVIHADARGAFAVDQLAVGEYELSAEAEGFQPTKIVATLRAGEHGKTLTIRLNVAAVEEQVQVNADETAMRGSGPGGGITLSGRALDNLPTDPAALLQQLQQLSGGDLPQLFVDGFSGGALPPKNTIREIRINENTYSAKNDVSPSFGQIEVFTKPGSGSWHGSFFALGNDSAFNTSNPYTPNQPPYYNWRSSGDISGPLNRRASFDAELFRTSMQTSSIANGIVLDPSLAPITVFAAVQSPDVTTGISPRLDLAAGKNSTIIARYSATHETHINNGIVQLSLPTQAYNSNLTTQLMQLSNSQTIGASILNDTRFQYTRIRTTQAPASTDQTVSVQGAFTGGGNTLQRTDTHQDVYELQNYLTAQAGRHFLNLGARLRVHRDASFALSNFNGTFVYSSIASYQRTQRDALLGYSAAQIAADGGGATQFSLTAGSPRAAASVADAGAFAQDDWKVTPGVTLLAGLRYEAQSAVSEHHDFAPRAGLYWDLGARSGTHPRGPWLSIKSGAGLFYSRLDVASVLQATRLNGSTEQQYIVNNPAFLTAPASPAILAGLSTAVPTTYRISPQYHSPYLLNAAIAFDHSLGKLGQVSANYSFIRGVHLQLQRNINAPLPGTFVPGSPASGVRPLGTFANLDQYESTGISRSNRAGFSTQLNVRKLHLYAAYDLHFTSTDANSGGFPSNGYNLHQDYGRAPDDVRHTVNIGLNGNLFHGFSFFTFLHATSGAPFNITTGTDLNGDSQFTDRPSYATDLTRPSVVHTDYGYLDASPLPGQQVVPYDLGRGPAQLSAETALRYEFGVGPVLKAGSPAPSPAARRYNAGFAVVLEDLPNFVNRGTPVGVLSSPLFGQSTNLSANSVSPNANRVVFLILNLRF